MAFDKTAVADAISTLVGLNSALKDLPAIFNAVRNAIDTTSYKTSIANLKALFDNTQSYVSLFYTDQEKFSTFTKQLQSQFSALNAAIPATRAGFRALVDSINVTDQATSSYFAGLVALAPQADAYYKVLEEGARTAEELARANLEAAKATNELIARLKDESNFKTNFDFQRYQGIASYDAKLANARIPSYDVGTNYVPNDGLAMLHKGEAVVPAKFNTGSSGDMTALVSEVRDLKSMMQANTAQAKRAADVLVKITPNGNALQTEVYVP